MNKKQTLASGLFFSFFAILPTHAEESANIDQINVTAKDENVNEIKKTHKVIQQEMINNIRDVVRYTTDVGISDNGRHFKGFAIRGVEGNRVGISVDGVSLPDSEENSLYARYGNFNPSRMSIDPELVQSIDIYRGSNSFNSGSGALGGSINYKTLSATDIVMEGNRFGSLFKFGYANKNREWVKTAGIGYLGNKLDLIILYSNRSGHEMKSNGTGNIELYNSRQKPDPATHKFNNYLFKLGYSFNTAHRIAFSINGQKGHNYTNELSYLLIGSSWRESDDENKRVNSNISYMYTPDSAYLALLKADIDYQYTDLAAVNYKGSRRKRLDEIYDRRMKTKYTRIGLQLDSQQLNFFGEHILSASGYIGRREFENINYDSYLLSSSTTNEYTIQYPVQTIHYNGLLKDKVTWYPTFGDWNPVLSAQFGTRFNREILEPQSLNAYCNDACRRGGKPNKVTFDNIVSFLDLNAQVNNTWKLGYNVSSGYRVPTASEMFFTFKNAYGSWQANPDLRSERSVTHSVSIEAQNETGLFNLNVYQSNYKDFIFEQENIIKTFNDYYEECAYYGCNQYFETPSQQMVNIDKARIRGLEAKFVLNLNHISPMPEGLRLSGTVGYSKGKLSTENSLLSIQPIKAIFGLDYEAPSGNWGIFNRLTYLGAKKAKDARVIENVYNGGHYQPEVTTYKYLNKSAYLFDMFGYYKPTKNITLRAGVYNLFNRTYHTWDALRGINAHSTTNSVDRDGKGLQRFYAPGRNYAASMEIQF